MDKGNCNIHISTEPKATNTIHENCFIETRFGKNKIACVTRNCFLQYEYILQYAAFVSRKHKIVFENVRYGRY